MSTKLVRVSFDNGTFNAKWETMVEGKPFAASVQLSSAEPGEYSEPTLRLSSATHQILFENTSDGFSVLYTDKQETQMTTKLPPLSEADWKQLTKVATETVGGRRATRKVRRRRHRKTHRRT